VANRCRVLWKTCPRPPARAHAYFQLYVSRPSSRGSPFSWAMIPSDSTSPPSRGTGGAYLAIPASRSGRASRRSAASSGRRPPAGADQRNGGGTAPLMTDVMGAHDSTPISGGAVRLHRDDLDRGQPVQDGPQLDQGPFTPGARSIAGRSRRNGKCRGCPRPPGVGRRRPRGGGRPTAGSPSGFSLTGCSVSSTPQSPQTKAEGSVCLAALISGC
jgi:hypothetical protein